MAPLRKRFGALRLLKGKVRGEASLEMSVGGES